MTPVVQRRAWPTIVFLAAAVWFAIASLVPVAEQAWRTVVVAAPSEPSLDVETARLLNDGGIVVQVRDGADTGAAAFSRGLTAASHPLRLDILFDPQQMDATRLVATEALSRGLGAQCIPDAIEPLVQREAAGGERTYLASLGLEVVQAAYEADRFGKPVLPRWLFPVMVVLCGALAWFSRRLGRMTVPVSLYMPSMTITEDRRRLEVKSTRIEADIATTQAVLAKREAEVSKANDPGWWQQLNVVGRFRERQEAARIQTETAALARKLGRLAQSKTAVEAEISRNDRRLSDDRRRFDQRADDRVWMAGVHRKMVGVLALTAAVLATTHAAVAVTYPGALISASRFDEMLFRSDTLIATALEANPDLVETVGARCFARVVRPEPQEVTLANTAGSIQDGDPVVPYPPLAPRGLIQHCRIGVPCGHACIPAGHRCLIGQTSRVGQECGKGYISMAKTCRVDRTPPVTPVVARPSETSNPASTTTRPAYTQPDATAGYVPPPSPVGGGGGSTYTPPRTVVPTPTPQGTSSPRTVHVEGYDRSNGTHVQSYDRAAPGQGTGRGSRR